MASWTLGRTTSKLSYLSSIPLKLDNFTLWKYYPGPSQLTYDPKIPRFISYVGVIRYLWTSFHSLSSSSSRIPPWISSFTSYESTWNLSSQSFVPRTRPGPDTNAPTSDLLFIAEYIYRVFLWFAFIWFFCSFPFIFILVSDKQCLQR